MYVLLFYLVRIWDWLKNNLADGCRCWSCLFLAPDRCARCSASTKSGPVSSPSPQMPLLVLSQRQCTGTSASKPALAQKTCSNPRNPTKAPPPLPSNHHPDPDPDPDTSLTAPAPETPLVPRTEVCVGPADGLTHTLNIDAFDYKAIRREKTHITNWPFPPPLDVT